MTTVIATQTLTYLMLGIVTTPAIMIIIKIIMTATMGMIMQGVVNCHCTPSTIISNVRN